MLHVPSVNRGLGILFLCFMEKILGAWPNFKVWKMVADLGTFGGFMLEFTRFIY